MKKIVTIALFLITVITVSLNADGKLRTVICGDGTKKETHSGLVTANKICAQHGGLLGEEAH